MTNKSTKHLTKDKQVPEWRSNLDAVVAAFTIGWGLWSLWQNRGMTEHFLKFCSALLLSIPQWINASVIIFFWGVVTMGLRQRRDITSPERLTRWYWLSGFVAGFLFFLFQDAIFGFIKAVVVAVLFLIFPRLGRQRAPCHLVLAAGCCMTIGTGMTTMVGAMIID
jgi:hypothetical protein